MPIYRNDGNTTIIENEVTIQPGESIRTPLRLTHSDLTVLMSADRDTPALAEWDGHGINIADGEIEIPVDPKCRILHCINSAGELEIHFHGTSERTFKMDSPHHEYAYIVNDAITKLIVKAVVDNSSLCIRQL